MVYRGKPSAACGECRKKRSRCDQSLPACGQCIKAKRTCSGYRNPEDLMFFDESNKIAKKHRLKSTTSSDASPDGKVQPQSTSRILVPQNTAPIRLTDVILYQPLSDLAINFFMSNYVGSDPETSQFDYLPKFYLNNGPYHSELQQSIEAVGLAGYAKAIRRADLIHPARKKYISAIRGINNTLSSQASAGRDSTFVSVILLAMFEVMILPSGSGLQNLTKHLNGAMSIASLRMEHQRHTYIGRKLLGTLLQSVIMNCWIQNIPLPASFLTLKRQIGEKTNPSSTHANFLDIVMELIQFREALNNGAYHSPTAVTAQATMLDNRLRNFAEAMPKEAHFQIYQASTEVDQLVYDGYYHVYPQDFTAHLWNNVRSSRIRLHRVILNQCRILLSSSAQMESALMTTQINESEAAIRELANEMCATVPQLAGYVKQLQCYSKPIQKHPHKESCSSSALRLGTPPPSTPSLSNSSSLKHPPSVPPSSATEPPQAVPTFPIPRSASLYHILYQLRSLSTITLLPVDMRQWIQQRIQWIEGNVDADELPLLSTTLEFMPNGGFPIIAENEGVQEELPAKFMVEHSICFHPVLHLITM